MPRGNSLIQEAVNIGKLYFQTYKESIPRIEIEHKCFYDMSLYNLPEKYHPSWIGIKT